MSKDFINYKCSQAISNVDMFPQTGNLLLEGRQLRKQQLKAARLACLRVEFSEEYDEEDYTEEEAEEICNELYHET